MSYVTNDVTVAIVQPMRPPVTYREHWRGEMSERLNEHAWKACVGETLPWVRIPLSPPFYIYKLFIYYCITILIWLGLTFSLTELRRDARGEWEQGTYTGAGSCALEFSWTLDCERVLAGGVSK